MNDINTLDERGESALKSRLGALVRWFDHHQPSKSAVLLGTALLVGLGTAVGLLAFHWLLSLLHQISFSYLPTFFPGRTNALYFLLLPVLGGLLVGPLIYFVAPSAKGHGVPEIIEAVALRGGRIRPLLTLTKAVSSIITLGTGGSAGQEGPIVMIGSALGSMVGQRMHLSDERIRNLVACGAASGIAAIFNAPIAGVLFALEVILGEFSVGYLSSVVVSAVTASIVGRAYFGNVQAFRVPIYRLASPWELPLYGVLGLLAGGLAVLFLIVFYRASDFFNRWTFPDYLKPAVGGAAVGVIGLVAPEVLGGGYETIAGAMENQLLISTMIWLFVAKLIATSLTLGSGGSGGIFAPGLFMGAMLGGSFGMIVNRLFDSVTAPSGAYALVGMAALHAATAHAPLTAIMMIFEMTGDYHLILPLMLATVLSTGLAQSLKSSSIYTEKLTRKGIRLKRGRDIDVMQAVDVEEVMSRDHTPLLTTLPLHELGVRFVETHHHGFAVVKPNGKLYGVVTLQDLERAMAKGDLSDKTVGDIASAPPVVAFADDTMEAALDRMTPRGLSRLPVVERTNPSKLVGMIRRSDIVRAYNVGRMRQLEFRQQAEQLSLEPEGEAEFVQFEIDDTMPIAGKRIRDLTLPKECILVSVRRKRELIIPDGETILQKGDRLTALVRQGHQADLQKIFCTEP